MSSGHSQTIFLKFGPSFSKLTWSETTNNTKPDEKGIIGFNVIGGVNYLNFKYFNLSSGIGFIRKGGIEHWFISGNDPTYRTDTAKLNFLTINTTFNLKVPIIKIIEPFIFVGPRLDYLFSYSENEVFIKDYDDAKKLNKVIYGILLGGGINFRVKRFQLGIDFDYYLNINKLIDYHLTYYTNDSVGWRELTNKIYDNTFTVNAMIGYKF